MTQFQRRGVVSSVSLLSGNRQITLSVMASINELSSELLARIVGDCGATELQVLWRKPWGADKWLNTLVLTVPRERSTAAVEYLHQLFPLSKKSM